MNLKNFGNINVLFLNKIYYDGDSNVFINTFKFKFYNDEFMSFSNLISKNKRQNQVCLLEK